MSPPVRPPRANHAAAPRPNRRTSQTPSSPASRRQRKSRTSSATGRSAPSLSRSAAISASCRPIRYGTKSVTSLKTTAELPRTLEGRHEPGRHHQFRPTERAVRLAKAAAPDRAPPGVCGCHGHRPTLNAPSEPLSHHETGPPGGSPAVVIRRIALTRAASVPSTPRAAAPPRSRNSPPAPSPP